MFHERLTEALMASQTTALQIRKGCDHALSIVPSGNLFQRPRSLMRYFILTFERTHIGANERQDTHLLDNRRLWMLGDQ
jgi:hypothetical protein